MRAPSWMFSISAAVGVVAMTIFLRSAAPLPKLVPFTSVGALSSQPLALSADDSLLAVANPDNDTVSLLQRGRRQARPGWQRSKSATSPTAWRCMPDGSKAYAANTVSGTVSVIRINSAAASLQSD